MTTPQLIAQHFRQVQTGGNWTSVNLRDTLADVTWEQATAKVPSFNTIGALVYHIHYYVGLLVRVLEGGPLDGHDRFSYDHPPIASAADWQQLLDRSRADAERFAELVERLPEARLAEHVADPKYGTWHRNLLGVVEHTHYHLGQIVLLKKMLAARSSG
ncbi:MAG: DinB family protein [Bacteroidetes bacterium]|nr:DinB family protein [Bacteroidota bacterium]